MDWTQVLVALVATIPAVAAAFFAYLVHRNIKPPSGGSIGEVVEQARDLSAVDVGLSRQILRVQNGERAGNGGDDALESRP